MGLQYQFHIEAEGVMVPRVKPKELCYLTEPRIFFPLRDVCNPQSLNQGTKMILLCQKQ